METVTISLHVEKQYQELKNFWWNYFKIIIPQIPEEINIDVNEEIYFVPSEILITELIKQYSTLFPNTLNIDKTIFDRSRYSESYFFTCNKKIESTSRIVYYTITQLNLNPREALIISLFRRINKFHPMALKTTILLDTPPQDEKLVINSSYSAHGRKIILYTISINKIESNGIPKATKLFPINIYKIPV